MIKIRVIQEPWYAGYRMGIFQTEGLHETPTHVGKILFEPYEEGALAPIDNSVLRFKQEEMQLLMNDLWQCGIRPTDGTGSTGQLKATEKHLEDMRRLTFTMLEEALKE